MIQINKRLTKVSEYLNHNKLADIGSDHAYLPIYAIQKGLINKAIAGEVVKGPFLAAQQNTKTYGMTDSIEVKLGNGLEVIDETIDVITICGMGGPLIAQIIEEGQHKLNKYPDLILQANIHALPIRQVLQKIGYKIYDEQLIKDKKHIYEILVAKKGTMLLDEKEMRFGPILLKNKSDLFYEKWQRELESLNKISKQLEHHDDQIRYNEINQQILQIKEVLK
ncbi:MULTISPECIES: tRNA (adenine(22)-N(1))-methyltransferase [Mammaliicoccus]|uniref:tRNA (adenine(22)-N(1))-methyltransferase n=1 Tax=Mammaliicoccus TaxID=2803850 RepID=UPI000993B425|nr:MULTISPECIES: tRNA (adenine(22)-N(1))-methyltransferase TrmK [Mammaliicoccus]MBO3062410.1 tRNA (adenine(22)-N(1))-methyltransferase TrmK [Mammaliicoccus fleurettii]MEB7724821.1 tRNA (adenine(22)-N(1))-methyltransferase TrmK [Mammaliicoccus fleurettii]MEB7779457.1 tRNA (adenine(22)-N(1))-methyltransferase TrmK [Mammaliicoccus fleurettii]MEB8066965.1 tRNA (adenine(22)-N(1))-methyltransferase TrmK [Mammaliicoccus fleurettii]OOV78526.1 tRNA methyltransferase [Mammaliicoccus fleurettii]